MFIFLLIICAIVIGSSSISAIGDSCPVNRYNAPTKQPNIVFILADDLGWNDVGFHGYSEIPTQNLDRLAQQGVVLNSFYAHYMCTPSRVALMTGKYPHRFGLQNYIIANNIPRALESDIKILPQYMKDLGYSTHMIGKWNLGNYREGVTPTRRGFDTFFGFYSQATEYYNYTLPLTPAWTTGFDLHDSTVETIKHPRDYIGQYAPDLFAQKAVDVIHYHDKRQPLFLYFAHIAPKPCWFDAPEKYASKVAHISHPRRRKYAASVVAMDAGIGRVYTALKDRNMLDNTIIVFLSDNGGQGEENLGHGIVKDAMGPNGASNWPLRGAKNTQWEGGVRVVATIWSPLLKKKHTVSNQLYHISDFLPTFYSLGGGDRRNLPADLDGHDIWNSVSKNEPSPRTEVVLQLNPLQNINEYAMRWRQYKIVVGLSVTDNITIADWYLPLSGLNSSYIVANAKGALRCDEETREPIVCNPNVAPCLFDIVADPCERRNIAALNPAILNVMLYKLRVHNGTAVEPFQGIYAPIDPASAPALLGGIIGSWMPDP